MPTTPRNKTLARLGLNILKKRESLGLTQTQLSQIAGYDTNVFGAIERGATNPTLLTMAKIANALELSISELCEGVPCNGNYSSVQFLTPEPNQGPSASAPLRETTK